MTRRTLFELVGVVILAALVGMVWKLHHDVVLIPANFNDDVDARFSVEEGGQGEVPGYIPTGWNWKPLSEVEITIFDEPGGDGKPKKLPVAKVNINGMFGSLSDSATFHPVPVERKICGNQLNPTVLFMAESLKSGKIVVKRVPADLYFKQCP